MRRQRIRHLVVADGGEAVGILSDRDLENLGSMGNVEAAGDRMSGPIVTASPETTVQSAAHLLRGRAIGCLPVVEDDQVVGIVTTTDLLELVERGADPQAPKSRRCSPRDRPTGRRPPGPGLHAGRAALTGR
jgi:acetoin utilization protein AcuB